MAKDLLTEELKSIKNFIALDDPKGLAKWLIDLQSPDYPAAKGWYRAILHMRLPDGFLEIFLDSLGEEVVD